MDEKDTGTEGLSVFGSENILVGAMRRGHTTLFKDKMAIFESLMGSSTSFSWSPNSHLLSTFSSTSSNIKSLKTPRSRPKT
ncbi:hypothetical protein E2C01_075700 [Portunus trituberculatus]|uniref:Uncharacterized protein n=1 Tax=Portunus trituberculatus TaxID=210409 RepID=A0A5B7IH02_PORTR|nr:hypothetical protein [Portunus trituberculatus]